jgi:diguanylate cyclase (GGDEF)-like protein
MLLAAPMEAPAQALVVDDDPTALKATALALRSAFEVVVARSGADALRLIARRVPDIVLLDVDMPGLDGLAVCRTLKASPSTADLPVVFLTAHNDEATELRGLEAGASDFIAKPPRGPAMVARLNNLVRLRRATQQLRLAALTDGLTGLHNRASFDQTLQQELARADRQNQPVALLLIDVDHFKRFNDHHGHPAGDAALRAVAAVVGASARRPGDQASRYGGEEMALLLPCTDAAGAADVAQRLLDAIQQLAWPHRASPTAGYVTVSIGTSVSLAERGVADAEGLLARADAALYAAKQHGRNQAWQRLETLAPTLVAMPTALDALAG